MQWIDKNKKLLILVLFIVCFLPWFPFVPKLGAMNRLSAYANLGTWLQGVLTPAILLIAVLSFRSQTQAAELQTKAQNQANIIANKSVFIANSDRLVQHLAYRCLCAMVDGTPPDPTRDDPKMMGNVLNAMCKMFDGHIPDNRIIPIGIHEFKTITNIQHNKHYSILKNEIYDILSAASDVGLSYIVDNRIARIRDGIKSHPPI